MFPREDSLKTFIEKPANECKDEECKKGIAEVVALLGSQRPERIFLYLNGHQYIAATYLLSDLADKMKSQNAQDKLNILATSCLDNLVKDCVYNSNDLGRCIESHPCTQSNDIK